VPAGREAEFARALALPPGDVPWAVIGEVLAEPAVELVGSGGVERVAVAALDTAWRSLARENH
jgi:hypothetical protein